MEGVLRRCGIKDVDLRAAGVIIRFDLDPDPCNGHLLQLSVGCCLYQKGKYLLGHVEGEQPVVPPRRRPPPTPPLQSRAETPEAPTHWGGGLGPRPCKEALDVVQSLRLPLSDPDYFRISEMSLLLGVWVAEKDTEVSRKRVQVLGGGDRPGDGWTGELLLTRCAVAGNPTQPRTRADLMLSQIRVEASVYFLLLLCRERYAVSILLHTKEKAVAIYYIAEMYMYNCLMLRGVPYFSVVSWLAILMRFVNRTTV